MRWGVTQEAQNDHMTSTVCLKEIKNCQRLSVGPDFVVRFIQTLCYTIPHPTVLHVTKKFPQHICIQKIRKMITSIKYCLQTIP